MYNELETFKEMLADYLSEVLLGDLKAYSVVKNESITLFSTLDAAFVLNSPESDSIVVKEKAHRIDVNGGVVRTFINIDKIRKYLNNKYLFYFQTAILVNNILSTLVDNLGDLNDRRKVSYMILQTEDPNVLELRVLAKFNWNNS